MFKRAPLASSLGYDVHVVKRKDRVTPVKDNPMWEIEMLHLERMVQGKSETTDFVVLIPAEKHRWDKCYWMGLIIHKVNPVEGHVTQETFMPRLVTGGRTKRQALKRVDNLISDQRLEMLISLEEGRAKFGVMEIAVESDIGQMLKRLFEDGGPL